MRLSLFSRRGFPMAIFALAAVGGTGLGAVPAGWIDMTLGWRWIQWIHLMYVVQLFFSHIPHQTPLDQTY